MKLKELRLKHHLLQDNIADILGIKKTLTAIMK